MAKLAFLGLGVMGAPMAGHLQKAGHDVTVYNRTAAKADKWVETYGGAMAPTPVEAVKSGSKGVESGARGASKGGTKEAQRKRGDPRALAALRAHSLRCSSTSRLRIDVSSARAPRACSAARCPTRRLILCATCRPRR